jgi:hypothetical protein
VVNGSRQDAATEDTFAPVAQASTIRLLLSVAGAKTHHVHTCDVAQAFTEAHIDQRHRVYLIPNDHIPGADPERHLLRLNRSLYGLRTSPKDWFDRATKYFVVKRGFKQSKSDHCLFYKPGTHLYAVLYVDDIIFSCPDLNLVMAEKQALGREFTIKDLGAITKYLGVDITRSPTGVFGLSQPAKINKAARLLGLTMAAPTSTPMVPQTQLSDIEDEECTPDQKALYKETLGLVSHIATQTRPDIAAAVGQLSRYAHTPGSTHFSGLKHLVRYLLGTKDIQLMLGREDNGILEGYCDADLGGDVKSGKSTSGAIIRFNSSCIAWGSSLLPVVTLSTAESEFVSAAETAKHLIQLRELLQEINMEQHQPTVLYNDNQSAIASAGISTSTKKTRHIRLRFHYLKEVAANGEIRMEYLHTHDLCADLLTKILPRPANDRHRAFIMGM